LAIGDEALKLRAAGIYPYFLDLGRAWHELTGLPFVFGVWAARRDVLQKKPAEVRLLYQTLLAAKAWGLNALPEICRHAQQSVNLSYEQLWRYFRQLRYDLGPRQLEGLRAFFKYLHRYGALEEMPELKFI
jgi:chorismate dehydratase